MENYMVIIDLPKVFSPEFITLIPSQRQHINRLLKKGDVVNYSLSYDRKRLWVVVAAFSEKEVHNVIHGFPIRNYIGYTVIPLLFNETSLNSVPHLWLN
jgi:hypothetical protein